MKPRLLLASAEVPGGGHLKLYERDGAFAIMLDNSELMNSRQGGSEEALATLAWDRMPRGPWPKLLIGGLGMGFTLRAALAVMPAETEIVVAELVPEVVYWARGPMAALFAGSLDDPRVTTVLGDVADRIEQQRGRWDAILLDVDNGPDGLSRPENNWLYSRKGLLAIHDALRPGGVLALWSSAPDGPFTSRLKRAGFAVEEKVVRANGDRGGSRHVIWLATPVERPRRGA
ncbi:MAG: spermidine synthase [Polymorphobacter sp.]